MLSFKQPWSLWWGFIGVFTGLKPTKTAKACKLLMSSFTSANMLFILCLILLDSWCTRLLGGRFWLMLKVFECSYPVAQLQWLIVSCLISLMLVAYKEDKVCGNCNEQYLTQVCSMDWFTCPVSGLRDVSWTDVFHCISAPHWDTYCLGRKNSFWKCTQSSPRPGISTRFHVHSRVHV